MSRIAKGLPVPKVDIAGYVVLALVLGRVIQKYVNVPMLSERALGIYALAWVTKDKAKRETLASVAAALQVEALLVDSNVMSKILNALPG